MTPTLIIADDHEIFRDGLALHAESRAGFRVIASVASAQDALHACRRTQPDLLLLDLEMPGRDPLATIPEVRSVAPQTRVVILTAHCRDAHLDLALRANVAGFLLKSDSPASIFEALHRALDGVQVFSKSAHDRLARLDPSTPSRTDNTTRLASLTPREFEVLRNIARGLDNEQMAQSMFISKRTVERHVARLMDAIDIRDRTAIMRYAYEQGLTA